MSSGHAGREVAVAGPIGVRGWLLFWVVAVTWSSLTLLLRPVPEATTPAGWLVEWVMPPGWTVGMVILALAALVTGYLLLALRDPRAVIAARLVMVLQVVPGIWLLVVPPHLPAGYEPAPGSPWFPGLYFLAGLGNNVIWQPYFVRSKRVRATYSRLVPARPWAGLGQFACIVVWVVCFSAGVLVAQDLVEMSRLRATHVLLRVAGDVTMAVSDADMSLTMERLTRRAEAASLPLVAVRRDPGERDRIEVVVASPQPLPEARSAMLFGRRGLLEFRQVLGEPFKTEAEARAAAAGGDIEVIQDTVEGVYYVCVKAPVLTGAAVRHAAFRMTEEQGPRVLVQFDESGAQTLAAYSREHRNERLAVIFDGTVIMAPVIRDALPPSGIEISGRFSVREGVEMVHLLRFGPPLPLRVEVAEQRTEPGSGVWKPKWIMRDAAFLAGAIVVFVTALIAFIPLGRGEQAAQRALAV